MPPRRSTTNLALIKSMVAEAKVVEERPEPPMRSALQNTLTDPKQADLFYTLTQKLPKLEPQTIRELLYKVKQYAAWVHKKHPERVEESAAADLMPQLICAWLTDAVNDSAKTVRQPKVPKLNSKGEPIQTLMSSVTLLHYASYAQKMLILAYPKYNASEMREARNQVKKHADALIALHDLARHKLPPEQVGPSEVRILLEHFLREDTAHPGTVHPLNLQRSLFCLIMMATGVRISSVVATDNFPDRYLAWEDIVLRPSRSAEGAIIGIEAEITLKHFKAYHIHTRLLIRYRLTPIQLRANVIFDIPLYLFAHAFVNGMFAENDLDAFFAPTYTASSYPFIGSKPKEPVFWRGGQNSMSLDQSGPSSELMMSKAMRVAMVESGLRDADSVSVILYSMRKNFLTRAYNNPAIGPETARALAGHSSRSATLEAIYIQNRHDVSLTEALNLGEKAVPREALVITRTAAKFKRKTVRELTEADSELEVLLRSTAVIELSLSVGNSAWKEQDPFRQRAEQFANYDVADTAMLLDDLKHSAKLRIEQLRRLELRSAEHIEPSHSEKQSRLATEAAESILTSKYASQLIDSAIQRAEQRPSDESDKALELEITPPEEGFAADDELPPEEGPLTPEQLWQIKLQYLKQLVSRPSAAKPCILCEQDEELGADDKLRLWTAYDLKHKHLSNVPIGGDYAIASRAFHSPLTSFTRWAGAHGMNATKRVKLHCTIDECGAEVTMASLPSHLLDSHPGVLPERHQQFAEAYVVHLKESKRSRDKRSVAKVRARKGKPAELVDAKPAYDTLPVSYRHKDAKPDASHQLIRELMAPGFVGTAHLQPGSPAILAGPEDAQTDVERKIYARLAELRPMIPSALLSPDGRFALDSNRLAPFHAAIGSFDATSIGSLLDEYMSELRLTDDGLVDFADDQSQDELSSFDEDFAEEDGEHDDESEGQPDEADAQGNASDDSQPIRGNRRSTLRARGRNIASAESELDDE